MWFFSSHDQAGEYKCKISQVDRTTNKVISVLLTGPVFVNIPSTSIDILQQPPAVIEIKESEDLVITCLANSYPKPHYQWFRDNTKLDGETSNKLHVSDT